MARQPVTFLVLARKVTQRSRPRCAALRVPCVARTAGPPHKLARSASRPRAQTYSSEIPRLSCATRRTHRGRKVKSGFVCASRTIPLFCFGEAGVARLAGFGVRLLNFIPCAPPRYFANKRGFRRAPSELRSGARGVCPARASCAAPLVGEISREPRRGGAPGAPSFGYFSRQDEKSD